MGERNEQDDGFVGGPFGAGSPTDGVGTVVKVNEGGAMEWSSSNPYLQGPYAPVFDERDDAELTIEGELPRSLNGVFMRNGPNAQFRPEQYAYPFDGTGMIHAVYLEDGHARYRNRWVLTQELQEERAAGHRIYGPTFGAPPHANLANTNIIRHGGRYLALYEAGVPYEMDGELQTLGPYTYGGALPDVMSAHPKVDPETGELLAIAYNPKNAMLTYMAADGDGRLHTAIPFQAPWPAMVHDIAFTENYVMAFVCPFVLAPPRPNWQPDRGTAIAIVPRSGGPAEVRWLAADPFFHFHILNAFEDGRRIEVQLPWFSSYSTDGASDPRVLELHRIGIDLDSGLVKDERIDDQACEFPRINEQFAGRRNRYGYVGLRNPRPGETIRQGVFEAVAAYDVETGSKTVHTLPAGQFVGEPVFAADPERKGENGGFLLTFVYDAGKESSSLAVFDASDLEAGPVAQVRLRRRVPAGLHASWIPRG